MKIASDLDSPDFAGPINPDSVMHVEFYMHEAVDKWTSEVEGKVVKFPKVPYVRIMKPGDILSILETPVREDHKRRWPEKWLYFQMQEGTATPESLPGWSIEAWPELDMETLRNLQHMRFYTVEQIAGASDGALQKIGMGGLALREKAKAALRERGQATAKNEIAKRDETIAKQAAAIEENARQLAELQAQMQELLAKPKLGRPPKE